MIKRTLAAGLAVASLAIGATSASAAVINLGFSLDESGSVGSTNFNTTRDALADALAAIPTSGANQYRVAITTFSRSTNQNVVVQPTIVTAQNLATIQQTLKDETYTGGGTETDDAINLLANIFTPFKDDTTLFNITTDGAPGSQSATEAAALAAFNDFVDGISFEAVGSGINRPSALANMARIAGLGTAGDAMNGVVLAQGAAIPDASTTGFVIPVLTFADYEAAIKAKIGQIVIDTGGGNPNVVPLPAGLPLLIVGLGAFGLMRRRQNAA